jgi:lipopolysaccharide biosynthesis regulator YciM
MQIRFWLEDVKERAHLEDLGIAGKIILKRIFKNKMGTCNYSHFSQNVFKWQALMNTIMKFWVP